jgi:hypothetical protein
VAATPLPVVLSAPGAHAGKSRSRRNLRHEQLENRTFVLVFRNESAFFLLTRAKRFT